MKKLILLVGLMIVSLHAFPQTGGLTGTPSILTPAPSDSSIPTGQGFGGALGGATTNSIPNSSYNTTPGTSNTTTTTSGASTLGQQQMMQDTSLLPAPTTTPTPTQLPQNPGSIIPPSTPSPATNVPSATGVGTGAPSGF